MANKKKAKMELKKAHEYFSADYFNRSWDLIDKEDRTEAEDEQMLFLSIASHCHWKERDDYDNTKASIGYWHTSRVYCLLGDGENAKLYSEKCISVSLEDDVPAFYEAYGYEALARANSILGNEELKEEAIGKAREAKERILKQEGKDNLERDLSTI